MSGVQHRLDCSEPELVEEWVATGPFLYPSPASYQRCPECGRAAWIAKREDE